MISLWWWNYVIQHYYSSGCWLVQGLFMVRCPFLFSLNLYNGFVACSLFVCLNKNTADEKKKKKKKNQMHWRISGVVFYFPYLSCTIYYYLSKFLSPFRQHEQLNCFSSLIPLQRDSLFAIIQGFLWWSVQDIINKVFNENEITKSSETYLLFIQNKNFALSSYHRNWRQAFQQSRCIPSLGICCTKDGGVEAGAAAVTEAGQQLGGRRELGKRHLLLGGCPSVFLHKQ